MVRNGRGSEEGQVCSRPIMAWVGDVPAGGDFPSFSAVWIGFWGRAALGKGPGRKRWLVITCFESARPLRSHARVANPTKIIFLSELFLTSRNVFLQQHLPPYNIPTTTSGQCHVTGYLEFPSVAHNGMSRISSPCPCDLL